MAKKRKKRSNKPKSTSVEKAILNYLAGNQKKQCTFSQLHRKFSKSYSTEKVKRTLEGLLDSGKLTKTRANKVKIAGVIESAPLTIETIEGTVDLTARGDLYVVCQSLNKDVFVSRKNGMNALQGDTVAIKLFASRRSRLEGIVVDIVKRKQDRFMGTFQMSREFAFVVPDDRKMRYDLFVPKNMMGGAQDGDKVIAKIVEWKLEDKNPTAKVEQILTGFNRNELEMNNVLLSAGFDIEFPPKALEEADSMPEEISAKEISKRHDHREVVTFTIDPVDAKDFDDALSVRELENGNFEIGIHIADVSHYVKQDSALDKEAINRTTSVYLPDRVCPMLPERLSNNLCSLRPNEDRLAFSVLVEFDSNHKVVSSAFTKSVIHSNKRFTYGEVQDIIDGAESEFTSEVNTLITVSRNLRKNRFKNGSINFESEEVRFELNEEGYPIGIYTKDKHESNQLVEEFMLLANILVAKYVSMLNPESNPIPMVYRVHDGPNPEKLDSFSLLARRFGHLLKFDDESHVAAIMNDLIKKIHGKPEQAILEKMAIRSMSKAKYTTENIGHFGLAFEYYTHFTSPIRRYPDVLVHRILEAALKDRRHIIYPKDELEVLCQKSSDGERSALEAEREAIKYKQVEYLSDKIGEEFDGIITWITAHGFFVEMVENKCEGFVAIREMADEPFAFDDVSLTLTGLRTGHIYRMGDKLRVVIEETNIPDRKVDLGIVDLDDDEDDQ